jgi:5-methylcytosine-specific restriction endonuclease McrA
MAMKYFRVGSGVWLSGWPDDVRLAAFYVLTSPHRNTEGIYRLPIAYAATDLKWTEKKFRKALDRLVLDGFAEYDDASHVILIVNALKWQAPDNPNQVRSAVASISSLPASPLVRRFVDLAEVDAPNLAAALRERLSGEAIPVTAKPLRDPVVRAAIRERDGDVCRYCGDGVVWSDRRGPRGGTYDHVDPYGLNDASNVVVACRSCNSAKGARTPDEAGMVLTPEPDGSRSDLDPDLHPLTPSPSQAQSQDVSGGMGLSASAGGHLGDLDDEGVRF